MAHEEAASHPSPERPDLFPAAFGFVVGISGSIALFFARWNAYLYVTAAVLALAAVGVWRASTRRLVIGLAAGWLAPPALALGFFLWWSGAIGDLFSSGDFDAVAWRAKHEAPFTDRTRLRMVDDLRRSGRLDGRTRAEVLDLLGPPSSRSSEDGSLSWCLGPDGIGIDSCSLAVRFGGDGKVAATWVFQN